MHETAAPTLIILPSFTGQDIALDAFTEALAPLNVRILQLPTEGEQDYDNLVAHIRTQLPSEPIILLGESFSVPIAAAIAARAPNVKKLILVSGFLSLSAKAPYPLRRYPRLPKHIHSAWTRWRLRNSLFNRVSADLQSTLTDAIRRMPLSLYEKRVTALQGLPLYHPPIKQPCLVIQGEYDALLDTPLVNDLSQKTQDIQIATLPTHHFVLQSEPTLSATIIKRFIEN